MLHIPSGFGRKVRRHLRSLLAIFLIPWLVPVLRFVLKVAANVGEDRFDGWVNSWLDAHGVPDQVSAYLLGAWRWTAEHALWLSLALPLLYILALMRRSYLEQVPVTPSPPMPAPEPPRSPDVVFGAPQQRASESWLKWWHVAVSSSQRMEDCRVFLIHEGRKLSLRWPTWQGPTEYWTLRPDEASKDIPVVIRSEINEGRWQLPAGVARITDVPFFVGDGINHTNLPAGLHEVRLRVERGSRYWQSAPYRVAVPRAGGNTNFEMHALAEGTSVFEPPDAIKSTGLTAQWLSNYYGDHGTPLTDSWVEGQLVGLGFDREETRSRAHGCLTRLLSNGIFSQERARNFFSDVETLATLRDAYRVDLRRTAAPVDPIGFCQWGPRLHLAAGADRARVEADIRNMLRDMYDHGER